MKHLKLIATMLLLTPLTSFSQETDSVDALNKYSTALTDLFMKELQKRQQAKNPGGVDLSAANDAVASALSKKFFIFKPADETSIKTSAEKLKALKDDTEALEKGYTIFQPENIGSNNISYKVTTGSRTCFVQVSRSQPLSNARTVTVDSIDCTEPEQK
ncbi:hypothetical protein RA06_001063 [Escherichia coli]|nr:hypothetical protein [Escherichia coli]